MSKFGIQQFLIAVLFLLGLGLFFGSPTPVFAEVGRAFDGYIYDANGVAQNGVQVRVDFYRPRKTNEPLCTNSSNSNCCAVNPDTGNQAECKANVSRSADTHPNWYMPEDGNPSGYYEFKDLPCSPELGEDRVFFYLYADPSRANRFVMVKKLQNLSAQGNSTRVLGLSVDTVLAADATPSAEVCYLDNNDCEEKTTITNNQSSQQKVCKTKCTTCPPGQMFNKTTNKCEPPPPPPTQACNLPCTKTDSSACDGDAKTVPGCSCIVPDGATAGKCATCPADQPYNPTTKKCEPAPACNSGCTKDDSSACDADSSKVPGCKCILPDAGTAGNCGVCPVDKPNYNPATKKCEPAKACNLPCTKTDSSACEGDAKTVPGCSCIVPDGATGGNCGVCPGDKPYNPITKKCEPVVACNTPCDIRNQDSCKGATNVNKDDCSVCKPGSGGNTCQTVTKDACACGGDFGKNIEATNLVRGQVATITGYAVVSNKDKPVVSSVKSLIFHMSRTKDNGATSQGIADSAPIPVEIVSSSPNQIMYKAVWKPTIPANIDPSYTYIIGFDQPVCQAPSQAMSTNNSTQAVLGASTSPFQQLLDFLFGWATPKNNTAPTPAAPAPAAPASTTDQNLQLKTLQPATIDARTCRFVTFKFTVK